MTIDDFRNLPVYANNMRVLKEQLTDLNESMAGSDQGEKSLLHDAQRKQIQAIQSQYEKAYMRYVDMSAKAESWMSENCPDLITETIIRYHFLLGYSWEETAECVSNGVKSYTGDSCRKIIQRLFRK